MASVEKFLKMDGVLGGVVGAGAGLLVVQQMGPFEPYAAMAIMGGAALGSMTLIGQADLTTMTFIEAAAATGVVMLVAAQM